MSVYPGTILIVDDNELNRTLLRLQLQREGHQVETAEHGMTAIEMLWDKPFDIVLQVRLRCLAHDGQLTLTVEDNGLGIAPDNANKAGQMAPLRILLAEDNLINQQLITKMLGRMSYKADIVTNGCEAIAAMRQKDYNLVLMDVQMPEMDGLEATRAIRTMRVGARQPWIIAVTAGSVEGDREACFAAGMNDFIAKPVEQQILARALARCQVASSPQEQASVAAQEQPQPAATRPAPPSLDRAVLKELTSTLGDQGDSLLTSLIRTFIEGANSLQASACEALGRGDSPTLRRAMHTLKSNASTFGAQPLATLCRDLEQRAVDRDLSDAGAALDAVATEFARVREALEAL
jgi:CheY-like chemotaxis protein/HPt (histidine-containing phosphotransfer) domain-containing protein